MKRWILISAWLFLLSGCSNTESVGTLAQPTPDQVIPSHTEGISLELIQHEFMGSPNMIETKVLNEGADSFEIGPFYHIEVKKEDGWYIITYSDAVFLRDPHFRDGGFTLDGHSEIRQTFSVENLGVSLPAGEYRLVKTLLQRDPYYEITVAATFSVQ